MKKVGLLTVLGIFFVFVSSTIVAWAVPSTINFQGRLTDKTGTPLNGDYDMTFRLFNVENGGTFLWTEDQTVTVTDGVYSVELGSVASFDTSIFENDSLYLEVWILNEEVSPPTYEVPTPRQKITSTAFAIKAGDSEKFAGYDIDHFDSTYVNVDEENSITSVMIKDGSITSVDIQNNSITSDDIAEGAVTSEEIMDSSVESKDIKVPLHLSGTLESDGIIKGENTFALEGYGVFGLASGTKGFGVVGKTTGSTGRGVYGVAEDTGDNSLNFGGYFHSKGGNGRGVYGQADGSTGIGVKGVATKEAEDILNYGGFFEARGFRGKGVYGVAKGTVDDNGVNDDPGDPGRPRIGGYFVAYGQYARGVQGQDRGTEGVGGYFISEKDNEETVGGKGVHAVAKGTGGNVNNYNVGGYFEARSDYGRGVYGEAKGSNG
ncbi:MAG: hypothetical protein DRG83_12260, partial [Deltaproteobacteria bacterium]